MPKGSPVLSLPAPDRFKGSFESGVRSQVILDRPTADARPVGLELVFTEQFTDHGIVGVGRFGPEQSPNGVGDVGGPGWPMIPAGCSRTPALAVSLSTGTEVIAIEGVKAGA